MKKNEIRRLGVGYKKGRGSEKKPHRGVKSEGIAKVRSEGSFASPRLKNRAKIGLS